MATSGRKDLPSHEASDESSVSVPRCSDSSDSDSESEAEPPTSSFHRRVSTNRTLKNSVRISKRVYFLVGLLCEIYGRFSIFSLDGMRAVTLSLVTKFGRLIGWFALVAFDSFITLFYYRWLSRRVFCSNKPPNSRYVELMNKVIGVWSRGSVISVDFWGR